jgi:hypothetical protein
MILSHMYAVAVERPSHLRICEYSVRGVFQLLITAFSIK